VLVDGVVELAIGGVLLSDDVPNRSQVPHGIIDVLACEGGKTKGHAVDGPLVRVEPRLRRWDGQERLCALQVSVLDGSHGQFHTGEDVVGMGLVKAFEPLDGLGVVAGHLLCEGEVEYDGWIVRVGLT